MRDDTLNDRRARERGDINHRAVLAILDEHRRGVRDNSRQLWGLLTLELWRRSFIDRQPEMRCTGAKSAKLDDLAENAAALAENAAALAENAAALAENAAATVP